MLSMKADFSRLFEGLDRVDQTIKDAVRPAAHAGAKVLYTAALAKVPVAKEPHYDSSTGKLYPGGDLKRALYRAFAERGSEEASTGGYTHAKYRISWNSGGHPKKRNSQVTHGFSYIGHLIEGRGTSLGNMEFGHWQPFVVHKDEESGRWYTIVRPEMRNKPLPKSNASMAEKLKFFYPWPGGPRWTTAQPFLRPAYDQNIRLALVTAKNVIFKKLQGVL